LVIISDDQDRLFSRKIVLAKFHLIVLLLKNAWNSEKKIADTIDKNFKKEEVGMKHTTRQKPTVRGKATFKHLAAAFAGAVMMSAMMLPGIPMTTAHAAVNTNVNSSQRTSKPSRQGSQMTFQSSAGDRFSSNLQPKVNTNQVDNQVSPQRNVTTQANNFQLQRSEAQVNNQVEANKDAVKPTADKATGPAAAKPSPSNTTKQDGAKSTSSKKKSSPTDHKKVVEVKATAYASGSKDNDQWGDKTFTGTKIRPGVIAVDPSVIPLGSKVYVEYPDGHGEYAVAEDTGGAIKGNRIDVVKSTEHEASNFGIQNVKVHVVKPPTKS
jgi:3D (Asp-Asp-Asp) domain-containing protein